MTICAAVFDAYGTLFDVSSVATQCEVFFPTHGQTISTLWRQKQLEYTWLRSLMGNYVDFNQINHDALRYVLGQLDLPEEPATMEVLVGMYTDLPVYPDVVPTLEKMGNIPLWILSNGVSQTIEQAVNNVKIDRYLKGVLSADSVKTFKPSPKVYDLALKALSLPAQDILFVSSNGWDVAGAKTFGFKVAFLTRQKKPPEELGQKPNFVIDNLAQLVGLFGDHTMS